MPEYTDQEIEMLAQRRYVAFGYGEWVKADHEVRASWVKSMRERVDMPSGQTWGSVLRLMREARERGRRDAESQTRSDIAAMHSERDAELDRAVKQAREQGAAEMRERAALVTLQPDICPVDGPVAAERIRSLPLTVPQ